MIGSDGEPDVLYWACVHGHVFRAALPPAGQVLTCPEVLGDEPCRSSFVYEPFDTEQDAVTAASGGTAAKPNYAPWAGPRHPVCDRLAYWTVG